MRILCTFPGKFGDLLWALPTIRALAARIDGPVDLLLAANLAPIAPLLRAQDYLQHVWCDARWLTVDTAPISPRVPVEVPAGYDAVYHLGYTGWPRRPLPYEILDIFNGHHRDVPIDPLLDGELALDRPWITMPTAYAATYRWPWVYGFTDEHFELKHGLVQLLTYGPRFAAGLPACAIGANPRWMDEAGEPSTSWEDSARLLRHADVFLGCCSALHVLAVAVGTPVVLMEPNPHRHHPIFYPVGQAGPQVTLVTGNDGLPTFDARHVRDVLTSRLTQLSRR